MGRLSAPAQFVRTQQAPPGFITNVSSFLQFTFPATGVAPGTYLVFAALVQQGAFQDDRIDPGDIIVLDVKAFTFSP